MTHQRQIIREAAVLMLVDKGPWLDRVFTNRMKALSQRPTARGDAARSQLPALIIYTLNETASVFNAAPLEYKCTVQLMIELVADANDNVDVVLDDMCETVERILGRDDTILDTANDCTYTGTQLTIVAEGAERAMGGAALSFDVNYYRMAPDEGYNETLPDLDTVHVEYSLDNEQTDPRDRAKTHIEV